MPIARPRVLIAGGGFAAVETLLALRALAGSHVDVDLVAPTREFRYRPAATAEPFEDSPPLTYDLASIARDMDARLVVDALASVAPAARAVRLASHARLRYDFLVLAMGARASAGVPGASTFRDQRDVPLVRRIMLELWSGRVERLALAVPAGRSWPLPMYELALLAARETADARIPAQISLATAERHPLQVFGEATGARVADLLADHGVRFTGGAAPVQFDRHGHLQLRDGRAIATDRVIAAPVLGAPRIPGIPGSFSGFVPVDAGGRVAGVDHVFAAGDITSFPVKQGGLAAQQADAVAREIADAIGIGVRAPRQQPELRARLHGGRQTVLLRTALDGHGRPQAGSFRALAEGTALAEGEKVAARYLTPYLAERQPLLV